MTAGAAGGGLLAATLVAAAVLLGGGPGGAARRRVRAGGGHSVRAAGRGRRPAGSIRWGDGGAGPVGDGAGRLRAGRVGAGGAADPAGRASPTRWWRRPDTDPATLLGTVVTAVAAEVRAGRAPADAWRQVLGVPVGPDGVPAAQDVLLAVLPERRRSPAGDPSEDQLRRRVAGVLAAGRLAAELGAPTAGVLEECARTLAADADAETAVRGALAGPRQTTSLLTWLPVLGVVLGTLLGANPLGVLLGGGAGTAAGLAGLVLTLAGRRWTRRMVAGARTAGAGSAPGTASGAGSGGRASSGGGADPGSRAGRRAGTRGG